MSRYLERAENTARLLDVGFRMALTGARRRARDEWKSVLVTTGQNRRFARAHPDYSGRRCSTSSCATGQSVSVLR
jgi:uncharacterized alpha-E superfamily protein